MDMNMLTSLLSSTRADLTKSGHLPPAKPFPGQIPTPEGVDPGNGGHLDPKKVVNAMGRPPKDNEDFKPDVMPGYKPLPGPATDMEITRATGDVHPYAPAGPAATLASRKTR
jgi:hypothetical protein